MAVLNMCSVPFMHLVNNQLFTDHLKIDKLSMYGASLPKYTNCAHYY